MSDFNNSPNISLDGLFHAFNLDPKTHAIGHLLTEANRCVIQNIISAHAHEHLQLTYDDKEPTKAALQQQYIKGAIDALRHLLTADEEVRAADSFSTIDPDSDTNS